MSTAPAATPPAPSSSSSSPPPSTPTPPPATPSSPPPTTPSAPPPATPSAPPPTTPSAPPPATPSAPPPAVPSAPPPAVPSAPPPAVPSAPPPSAPPPAVPSAPPPAVPSSPPPPTSTPRPPPSTPTPPSPPATPSRPTPTPPPSGGGRTPPPPVPRAPPSSKTPTPPPPPSSSSSVSTPVLIGIVAAGAVTLLLLAVFCLCCLKRRKRADRHRPPPRPSTDDFYAAAAPPPPPPSWAKQQKDDFGGQPQTWHQTVPPPRDHAISVLPPMPPPPVYASRPALPSPPVLSSSGGSGSNYSMSETPMPPAPGYVLGFLKSTFTFEELEQATNGFSDTNLLGKGGFGYVHKGVLPNGQEVAVKQLKTGSGQGDREFHAEVEIISRVHHKHLVSLVGYCTAGDRRLLVYEFVPNNNLEFHLHGKEPETLEWSARLKIALGSAKGLAYLHEDCHPKIIHRDIKASNILLDSKFEAKVSDFGLAKFTSDNNTHVSTRVMGTFGYLAPEYASSGKLTEKSDVFSFGVMLLELITGRRPVDTASAFMEDSLVDWARPLLNRALEDGNFETLADPRLQNYNVKEMARMVACAAACIHYSARRRPRMSQVVRVLEGDSSFEILNEGLVPGHSPKYSSYSSSEYDVGQYNEDMKRFRKLALNSQEYASSDYPTSEYGQNPSASSSEAVTREMDLGKINKNSEEHR